MANAATFSLFVTDRFTSSNYACPITDYYLQYGSNEFELTDTLSSGQSTLQTFTISLRDSLRTIQNAYSYEIVAIAEGGVTASAASIMTVTQAEYDCRSAILQTLEEYYYFDLPAPG